MPIFQSFYTEYAELFRRKHLQLIDHSPYQNDSLKTRPPLLWKTVGDEIIFVNTVESCFEVFYFVKAFSEALQEYDQMLKDDKKTSNLGVKGSAWIASFPFPNSTIMIPDLSKGGEGDLTFHESIESSADNHPHLHEFLGKGLDYGFRISQHSSDDFFAVSPALANILARAGVNEDYGNLGVQLRIKEPVKLKGVLDGRDYPVIGIPIYKSEEWAELRQKQEKLLGSDQTDQQDLRRYFQLFLKLYEVEEPSLKVRPDDPQLAPPSFYSETFVPGWVESAREVIEQDKLIEESSKDEGRGEIDEAKLMRIIEWLSKTIS